MKAKTNLKNRRDELHESPYNFKLNNLGTRITRSSERSFAAFTIIELIVVIATIGVLGTLLITAHTTASNKAPLAQCFNNMRQICQATRMYATENQDYLPYPNWATYYNPSLSISGWLYTQSGSSPPLPTLTNYKRGLLWKYLNNTNIYWCPADNNPTNINARSERFSTYLMNGAACGFGALGTSGSTGYTYKLSQIKQHGVIMWEPDNAGTPAFVYNDGISTPTESGISKRHVSGSNLAFLDGHVEFANYAIFDPVKNFTSSNPLLAGPSKFWWDPTTSTGGNNGYSPYFWPYTGN